MPGVAPTLPVLVSCSQLPLSNDGASASISSSNSIISLLLSTSVAFKVLISFTVATSIPPLVIVPADEILPPVIFPVTEAVPEAVISTAVTSPTKSPVTSPVKLPVTSPTTSPVIVPAVEILPAVRFPAIVAVPASVMFPVKLL